jgi:pimeloyl-ACP methyl ester carboxylesterase
VATSQASLGREVFEGHSYLVARPVGVSRYKEPIVFVHGASGFAEYFSHLMRYFSSLGFVCYALDIVGHGKCVRGVDISNHGVMDYTNDVSHFLDHVVSVRHKGVGLILVGHSMGGLIVALLASLRTDVGHTVLITPAPPKGIRYRPGGMPGLGLLDILGLIRVIVGGGTFVPSKKLIASLFADPIRSKQGIARWTKGHMVSESKVALHELLHSEIEVDHTRISADLLVVGAQKDVVVHPETAREVAEYFKGDLVVLNDLGHMCPFEAGWRKTASAIARWLCKEETKPQR